MRKEMIFSLVAAIAVVGALLWIADHSLKPVAVSGSSQSLSQVRPQQLNQPPSSPAMPYVRRDSRPMVFHGISKCIVHGVTVYSNEDCPKGSKHEEVVLYDSAGIADRSKEQLAAIQALKRPATRTVSATTQSVPRAEQSQKEYKQAECDSLKKTVEHLDAMARQPQSPRTMDDIRERRKKARDRQYALRC